MKSTQQRRFESALRQVLSVSKVELANRIEQEKVANAGKPKRGPKPKSSASARVSGGSD
jgi:hypothetical protein